jgi:hypothetical protein
MKLSTTKVSSHAWHITDEEGTLVGTVEKTEDGFETHNESAEGGARFLGAFSSLDTAKHAVRKAQ